MAVPLMRSYTTPSGALALGVFGLATDDITGLTITQLNRSNVLLDSVNLNQLERDFLKLRVEGLTMEEITEDLGDSAYKIRQNLQDKVAYIL